ncbi:MAG: Bax inhibitor-1/YccA family protein [Saprospiraceae bacterium]
MAFNLFNESSNPVLKQSVLDNSRDISRSNSMTAAGAVNKTLVLGVLLLAGAIIGWTFPNKLFFIPAAIAGLVLVLIATFKKEWSPIIAPIYALVEGVFVGAVSLMYASLFDGIIFHAVSLTIGVLFLMLFLYKAKIIEVTQRLRSVIMMATGAIMLTYLVFFVLSFFNIQVPMIHSTGWLGIGFSLVVVVIASLNLLLDFDFFEKGEQAGLPKYMEWFAGMGLMITLVWLYLEILRLLSKISSRD